jgi:hypothetical protein
LEADAGPASDVEATTDAGPASAAETDADETRDQDGDLDEGWCDEGCLDAAQFRYAEGCLTLVTPYALRNEQVHLGETPARIDALLGCPKRPGSVLIVTSLGSPWFGQLLLEHAPYALLAFAALLALSLWRAGKHLGPKQPLRSRERRQMLEHITAVGMLASRVGLVPLLAAARRELRQQLLKRIPYGASLSGDALVSAVAEVTELSPHEVQRALLDEPSGSTQQALAIARAMQALWRKT